MKALVYHGPGNKAWEQFPDATVQEPTDVVVKVETTTICGTDLHILKGDVPAVTEAGSWARGGGDDRGGRRRGLRIRGRRPVTIPAITRAVAARTATGAVHRMLGRRRDRLDLRPADRRHPGRVRPRPVRRHLAEGVPRRRHEQAGGQPRRLLPTGFEIGVLTGKVSRATGRGHRGRPRRSVRDPDRRAVGRVEDDRGRLQQVPAREGEEFGATDVVEVSPT